MKTINKLFVMGMALVLASCGAKKSLVGPGTVPAGTTGTEAVSAVARQLAFVQKVSDQRVYAKNVVASMSFTAAMGDKTITVPGSVHMRRDEVIRLQLFMPLLGTEVGRLEFTPDYVLVVDRLHKQYVKGDYNQLDFLKNNGLDFYALQSLFWNQLLLPGTKRVGEADLQKFTAKLDGMGQNVPVTLVDGNMNYVWTASRANGQIGKTTVTYTSERHGKSVLEWDYANFKALGSKLFPATQEFSFTTTATQKVKKTTVRLEMNDLKTSGDWETRSTVSDKYKQMDARDIIGKLLNM